jgi:beta-fructofuranosidase
MKRREFLALSGVASAQTAAPARSLATDHQRPKFHFLPAANWMNDPNGPIYWKGRYHLFYQHNPHGPFWASMHWGHAVSMDMVHWRHLPVALAPSANGADKDGVWSGCCVVNNGVPTMLYTGTKPEVQCLAMARNDELTSWRKRPQPVIAAPPEGMKVTGFRDPCVWQEDELWKMALGSGIAGVGGMVLLYESPDLVNWRYVQPIFEGKLDARVQSKNPVATGEMWECPSLFPLGTKHVLFVSTQSGTPGWLGSYKEGRFVSESPMRVDWSNLYYAPITQLDEQGNRIVWGWIREKRDGAAQRAAGWSGVMSLPRVMSLDNRGRLEMRFAGQLRRLRGRRHNFVNLWVPSSEPLRLPEIQGDALEIQAEIELQDSDECGIQVLAATDGSESLPITYTRAQSKLSMQQTAANQNGNLVLGAGENLRLHVYVDCSVVEVIGNRRTAVTDRFYAKPDSTGIALFSRGGSARVKSLTIHELKSISDDRLTST